METRKTDIDQLIDFLSKEQLGDFIRKECAKDSQMNGRFMALGMGTLFTPDSSAYSDRMIGLIEEYGGRHGYISYSDSFAFNREALVILEEAEDAMKTKDWAVAASALIGIADCAEDILDAGDDSAGEFSYIVDNCFNYLLQLAKSDLPIELRESLFKQTINKFREKDLKEWGYWWYWMDIAIELAADEESQKKVLSALEDIKKPENEDWNDNYNYEKAQKHKLEMMSRMGTPEEQKRFMYDNVGNPDFRQRLLQMAWDCEDDKEVIRLAEQGLEHDTANEDRMDEWRKWELRVYRKLDDKENIMRLARHFFWNSRWDRGYSKDEMYALMKSTVSTEAWPSEVRNLLKECAPDNSYLCLYIYEKEEMWPEYIKYLQMYPFSFTIENAPEQVITLYRDEIIRLYEQEVRKDFAYANNRDHYRRSVEMLRKLIKFGGKAEADAIISEQKSRKPRRPALIDELSKL